MADQECEYEPYSVNQQQWARIWAAAETHPPPPKAPDLKDTIQRDPVKGVNEFKETHFNGGPGKVEFEEGCTKVYDLSLIDAYHALNHMSKEDLNDIWRGNTDKTDPAIVKKVFEIFDNFWIISQRQAGSGYPVDPADRIVPEKLPVKRECDPPPNTLKDVFPPEDWGRVFAYLFWLKAKGEEKEHLRLRFQCEYFIRAGVCLIVEEINKEVVPEKKIHPDYGFLFKVYFPSDFKGKEELLKDIANGIKPNYAIGMRMCC